MKGPTPRRAIREPAGACPARTLARELAQEDSNSDQPTAERLMTSHLDLISERYHKLGYFLVRAITSTGITELAKVARTLRRMPWHTFRLSSAQHAAGGG